MKKTLLLFMAITVTVSLYSMEQPVTYAIDTLPQDVKVIIIECFNQDISPDNIINDIKATSCTCLSLHESIHTLYGIGCSELIKTSATQDTHGKFRKLVHSLANKFNLPTGDIANKFMSPISQCYFNLFVKLQSTIICINPDINQASELIEQGADVNGSGPGRVTPLMHALPFGNINLITLLLNKGAHPDATSTNGMTITQCANVNFDLKKRQQITQLLEDAQKKLHSLPTNKS